MYIFSFRSRTQSMKLFDMLKANKISCKIINTPRQISNICGLSVSVDEGNIDEAKKIFAYSTFDTFLGLYQL